MNNVRCPVCGTPLAGDAVICQHCGRVVRRSSPGRPQSARQTGNAATGRYATNGGAGQGPRTVYRQGRQCGGMTPRRQTAQTRRPQRPQQIPRPEPPREATRRGGYIPHYDAPPHEIQAEEASGRFSRRGLRRKIVLISRIVCVALLAAVIYFGGFMIQTTRVKLSKYSFNSSMKMTYSSYGKAIDNYFEDGSWSANLLTANCSYKGTTKHGEEYELKFHAGMKVKLTGMTIDGEKVEKDKLESKIMGMFI